jgi:lia operon protein LiaF
LILIGLGVWFLISHSRTQDNPNIHFSFFGDHNTRGHYVLTDEEYDSFIGDTTIDLGMAEIPAGEKTIRFSGFIGDVKVYVPAGVGVSLNSNALITDAHFFGDARSDVFLSTSYFETPGFASAEKRIHLECNYFINDIRVTQA